MECNSVRMLLFFPTRTRCDSRPIGPPKPSNKTGYTIVDLGSERFSLLPLFLLITAFSVLAPLFWTHVESPPASNRSTDHENMDLYARVVPSLEYGYKRLGAGEWPLWASDQYCGIPYFAKPTHGLFQPLNLVFLFVPVTKGLALHAFLGLLLMGVFTALFLRAMGTGYIAAALGGIVFAFGGASAVAMSRPELLGVLAWMPLLYWIVFEHGRNPRGLYVVAGGFTFALMLLAGTPLLAVLLAMGAFAYGALRILLHRQDPNAPRLRNLGSLMMMIGIGLAFAAVQWVPYVFWLTTLADPISALWPRNWGGQAPGDPQSLLAAFLIPGGTALSTQMLYVGVVSLLLIPPAILRRQGRFEALYFFGAASFCIGIATWRLDESGSGEAWKALMFPGSFAVALLVGLGADRLLLAGRDPRSPLLWGSALLYIAAATIVLILGPAEARGKVLIALIILLPFFLMRVRWVGLLSGTLLALLLFVDLRGASVSMYKHPYTERGDWLADRMPALREAEALSLNARVLTLPSVRPSTLPANVGLLLGVTNARGAYWPLTVAESHWWGHLDSFLYPRRGSQEVDQEVDTPFYPMLLNHMAVRVVIGETNLPWMDTPPDANGLSLQFDRTLGSLSLWRNNTALPRVRMVRQWQPVDNDEAAIAALVTPDFPARDRCVVESNGSAWKSLVEQLPPTLDDANPGFSSPPRSVLASDLPESLVIEVDTPESGLLVVADSYAPGWRAYVDGKRASIVKTNGLFRGVYVAQGSHTVHFRYRPWSVTGGLALSGLSLIACALWMLLVCLHWLWALFRHGPSPAPGNDLPFERNTEEKPL